MKLELTLDNDLSLKLKKMAKQQHQTLETTAIDILQQAAESGNLEQRQFIGKVISGREIIKHDDLVLISGIYYRYQIKDNQPVNKTLDYQIINSDGNLIILQPRE